MISIIISLLSTVLSIIAIIISYTFSPIFDIFYKEHLLKKESFYKNNKKYINDVCKLLISEQQDNSFTLLCSMYKSTFGYYLIRSNGKEYKEEEYIKAINLLDLFGILIIAEERPEHIVVFKLNYKHISFVKKHAKLSLLKIE